MKKSENKIEDIPEIEDNKPHPIPRSSELIYHYWHTTKHVSALIRASEIKAGLILSFYGILLNFVHQSAGSVLDARQGDWILYTMIGIWFCTIVTSIFFSVQCFIPRVEGKFAPNVFFYKDVINKFGDVKAFSKTFNDVGHNDNQLFNQLGQQIYVISKIAASKFKMVQRSIIFLGIGLIMLLVIILYVVLRVML